MLLSEIVVGQVVVVERVGGHGSFRRRLLELGLVPGTRVELVSIAPLGDPLEFLVRGSSLSIRRGDAAGVHVSALAQASPSLAATASVSAVRGAS
jgi:Fe2+ transport system protein FeoA